MMTLGSIVGAVVVVAGALLLAIFMYSGRVVRQLEEEDDARRQ